MLRFLLVATVVIALVLHNLPYLIRDQAVIWLLKNGAAKAELTAIDVDWLSGRVLLDGLSAEAPNKPPLQANQISVDLDYSQLSEKHILLSAALSGIDMGIREEGEALWFGPINLNGFGSSTAEKESKPSAWSFGLTKLSLMDVDWAAEMADQKHQLRINTGQVADFYMWDYLQPVSVDIDGSLNSAPLILKSSSKPLPDEKSSELKIKLNNFPLHSVTALFLPELRAMVDLDLTIKARSNLQEKNTYVAQSGSIRLRDLSFKQKDIALQQKLLSWNGAMDVSLIGGELKNLNTKNNLQLTGVQASVAGAQVEFDSLTLKAEVDSQGLNNLLVKGLELDANQLALRKENQSLSLAAMNMRGGVSSADMQAWDVTLPQFTLNNVSLNADGEPLMTLGKGHFENVEVQRSDDMINVEAMNLGNLVVQGNGGVFSQWKDIGIKGLSLSKLQKMSVDLISLNESKTRVLLSEKRQLTDVDWLVDRMQSGGQANTDKVASSDNSKTPPFHFQIKKILLTGKNPVTIVDAGVKPVFKTTMDIHKLQLGLLDNQSSGKTPFVVKGKNKFSSLEAKGAIELFSGNYGGNWDVDIKGLELPQVSPYSLQYTGYYLHSGQLSLTTKGTIKKRTLAGTSDIRLNKLEVEAQNTERSGEFNQKVSMPLDTAIMILKDNDDNIDLQIPVDGSLDDPQFGYQTVINKLAGKGMKNAALGYLTKALQPFGALISIAQMAMDAKEKGSFITLQPVYFTPAGSGLSAESTQYVAKLAEMMKARKAMRMNICGIAVASDQPPIWAQLLEENKKQKKPLTEPALQEQLTLRLEQLAQARSDAIKGQLSEGQGISIERLFSCYPKVDLQSKEKPQVSLGL